MVRFSWATGLLGVSQLAAVGAPGARSNGSPPAGRAGAAGLPGLDGVSWAAQGQLGELLQAAYQAGCDLQDEWLDDALAPWRWPRAAARLAGRSLDTLRVVRPDAEGELSRSELKNKLDVYRWVKEVRGVLGLPPPGVPFPLGPYVARAYRLDAYRALWVVEGLGHDYAACHLRLGRPRHLLRGAAVADLPPNSLPMLHGGLGLAFAEHVLGSLSPESSAAEARRAIERFAGLCRENSLERHLDSALESFGLDARCFFPDLVSAIERGLVELDDPALYRFFWHGAGRALYFLPVNFIPGYGSLWHAVEMARREAPGETARHAALAGVAYAFTMVNMARPAILEAVLRDHGDELSGTAFVEGIVAAVAMRQEITPEAPALGRFLDHRPASAVAGRWRRLVRDPCRRALDPETGGEWRDRQAAAVYRSLPVAGAAR